MAEGTEVPREGLAEGTEVPGEGLAEGTEVPREGLAEGTEVPGEGHISESLCPPHELARNLSGPSRPATSHLNHVTTYHVNASSSLLTFTIPSVFTALRFIGKNEPLAFCVQNTAF